MKVEITDHLPIEATVKALRRARFDNLTGEEAVTIHNLISFYVDILQKLTEVKEEVVQEKVAEGNA